MGPARYPDLDGRPVLVSGGASGIGAAMVEAFAGQGSRVAFLDIDVAAGEALAARLAGAVRFLPCDLSDIAALRTSVAAAESWFGGGARVLVNNAARDDRHAMATLTPEGWRQALAVNLDHQFFATQAAAPAMAAAGGGAVLLFGSVSWMRGRPGMVAYTAAKAAINGMTRTLARELGTMGIRVNCVVPGAINTDRQARLWRSPEADREIMAAQALKIALQPQHVAAMALFLGAEASAGCTGQNFVVDAGITLN